jgi:diguanylate cyclase (GGDEF)-like protein/PAS domain S-box-containing protein
MAADYVFAVDAHWRFTYLGGRASEEIAEGKDLLNKSLWDEFPALLGTAVEQHYREAKWSGRRVRFEFYYDASAAWYEINASPLSNGGLGVWFRRIERRKRAEEELRRAEERYRLAASASADLLIDWDLEKDEIVWREAQESGFGFGDGAVKSHDWCVEQVHPADRAHVSTEIERSLQTGKRRTYYCRVRKADGNYAEVRQTVVVQRGANGKPLRAIIAVRDLTDWSRANQAIRRREAQLANIFSQALVGIVESGPDGRARLINSRFCEILGRTEGEIIGADVMDFTHPDDVEWNQQLYRRHRHKGEPFQIEKRYVRPDGSVVWCRVSVSFVQAPMGETESSIVVAEDITHQRQTTERLKWASEHDALTGLPNRRAFEARLQAATLRAMHSGGTVGLLLLDLDHFKHVNDGFGHGTGDLLLQDVGDRLNECVSSGNLVARLGGDEFAILVEGAVPSELGDAILRQLRRPFQIDGRSISIDASIGGAVFPTDAESAHELFKHADVALYALKEGGRGGTRMFHRKMLERALVVASQLALARSAVCDRSVDPHYQQKVDLTTGRIVGFEALLRWHHVVDGLQAPDTVAEAFRDYELASKIGGLMQGRVLADLSGWLQRGLPVGCIAINAAPVEFLRDDFAERLLARMNEHGVPPQHVEVEVTEHAFFEQGSSFVGRALKTLSDVGVRIALDDFGTGYSSLSHLRDFPVDVLKIDRSFVEKITSDGDARAIISAIATLAKSLRIELVAEGVETDQQRLVLLEQGCLLGQGFYFGRGVAADRVPGLLPARPTLDVACTH